MNEYEKKKEFMKFKVKGTELFILPIVLVET